MRTFVIADASKRKARPIGVLTWEPSPNNEQGRFSLEVSARCDEKSLPLSLEFCARREGGRATQAESEDWVRSRIVPEDRQNITEVLRANGLTRYDMVSLLALHQGRSSDDDLLVYEVDFPDGAVPETADAVIAAVKRQRQGAKVTYAVIDLAAVRRGERGEAGPANQADDIAMSPAQRIAACIREERLSQGFTQAQLAARAGITQTVMSRVESGAGNPTLSLLEEIAAALDMKLDVTLK